jgi:lathosterol oxidase
LFFMRGHRGHHKSITPTVYACYAFDVPEAMVIGAFIPLWLLAVPMQLPGLLIPSALLLVKNAMIHCGVELFPRGPNRSRWLCWFCTTTDHDRHHSTLRYNYAILFNFWDRAMGTDYPKVRDQVRAMPVAAAIEESDLAPGRAPGTIAINRPAPGASSA